MHSITMFIGVILLTSNCLVNGKIYMSSEEISVHVTKDISNFKSNINLLFDFISSLLTINAKTPQILQGLVEETYSNKSKMSDLAKEYINLTMAELEDKVKTCLHYLEFEHDKALTFYNSLVGEKHRLQKRSATSALLYNETDFSSNSFMTVDDLHNFLEQHSGHKIEKRYIIPYIGDTFDSLIGVVGPTQWSHQLSTTKKLSKALENEEKEVVALEHTVRDNSDIISDSLVKIENFDLEFRKYRRYFELSMFFENLEFKVERGCDKGKFVAIRIREDTSSLSDIRNNALTSFPDRSLFPPQLIKKQIELSHESNHIRSPYFSSMYDISQIYGISSAVTVIKELKIHSMLTMPLIDGTLGMEYIDFPYNLSEKDHRILSTLNKLALKSLDVYGCNEQERLFLIFSSRDLTQCQKCPNGQCIVCKGRQISLESGPIICSNPVLPSSIVIELSPTLLLLKTEESSIDIICPKKRSVVNLKAKIVKIRLGLLCEMSANTFHVGSYKSIDGINVDAHPLESMQITHLKTYEEEITPLNFHDYNETMKNHSLIVNALKNDLVSLNNARKETKESLEQLKKSVDHPGFMPFSVKIIIGFIIGTLLLIAIIKVLYRFNLNPLRCKKDDKGDNTHDEVSRNHSSENRSPTFSV